MIERVPRLYDEAIRQWVTAEQERNVWMKVYPHKSGELIKLTVGFYDTAKRYIGQVMVIEETLGAKLQTSIELDPQKEPSYF